MLPLEITTGYLNKVTKLIVESLIQYDINAKEPELLHAITKPFTSLIIQLDKDVLKNISIGAVSDQVDLRKHKCGKTVRQLTNETFDVEIKKCKVLKKM
jgi:sodium-dependent phosphate cotransporter